MVSTTSDDAAAPDVPATDVVAEPAVSRPLSRVRAWELGLVAVLAGLLYLPMLGSYSLWDPWETHYGEVARRMREDHDWIRMKWQNENFRSKPVLTFWLMAGGMKMFGVADDGGWSGEMVASHSPEWALRTPFALFGVFGVVMLWWAIARLWSKRAAWLAAVVLASCPYYFMISRQAITDMPSCALFIAAMALFAVSWLSPEVRLPRLWPRFAKPDLRAQLPSLIFLAVFTIVVIGQLAYFLPRVANARWMTGPRSWISGTVMMAPFIAAYIGVVVWCLLDTPTMRSVYFYWFYLLNGVAVLAKGPVSPALCALSMLMFWLLTAEWKRPNTEGGAGETIGRFFSWLWAWITRIEVLKGLLIFLCVALPWHFAIYLKDGQGWLNEYVSQHLLGRAFRGVHGDRGTFDYFLQQLGVGMWPWICLVPAALGAVIVMGRPKTREGKLRLFFGVWAIVGFTFFSAIQTKFHHYILPAVPAFAALIALWIDDFWERRAAGGAAAIGVSLLVFVVTSLDVVFKQERLVHLFIYRYDRPWPYGEPWKVDYTIELLILAVLLLVCLGAALIPVIRKWAFVGFAAVAVVFTVFAIDVLLVGASPHWGQRHLHETYYANREIHGADLIYYGTDAMARDWTSGKDLEVKSYIPNTLHEGDPMKVTWELREANESVKQKGALVGRVSRIDPGGHRFWIEVPPAERAKLASIVEHTPRTSGQRKLSVNADRLVAWQLNWRGENFYSGGEIWNPRIPDAQTVYMDTDNKKFLEYLKPRIGQGRTFWIVTEKGRLANLRKILPTDTAKQTVQDTELDNSSNKFGLARFTLDRGQAEQVVGPSGPLAPQEDVDTGGGL